VMLLKEGQRIEAMKRYRQMLPNVKHGTMDVFDAVTELERKYSRLLVRPRPAIPTRTQGGLPIILSYSSFDQAGRGIFSMHIAEDDAGRLRLIIIKRSSDRLTPATPEKSLAEEIVVGHSSHGLTTWTPKKHLEQEIQRVMATDSQHTKQPTQADSALEKFAQECKLILETFALEADWEFRHYYPFVGHDEPLETQVVGEILSLLRTVNVSLRPEDPGFSTIYFDAGSHRLTTRYGRHSLRSCWDIRWVELPPAWADLRSLVGVLDELVRKYCADI